MDQQIKTHNSEYLLTR